MKLTELLKLAALVSLHATDENPNPDVDFYLVKNAKVMESVENGGMFLNMKMSANVLGRGYLDDCMNQAGDFDIRLELRD